MTSAQASTVSFQAPKSIRRTSLVREVLADLDTPLSTYLKLAQQANSYLFESVEGGERWGRYSIIGLPCETVFKINNYDIEVHIHGQLHESFAVTDPLAWVEQVQAAYHVEHTAVVPAFSGGLVGYFGYETVAYVEKRLQQNKTDPIGTPDICLMLSEELVVFDNLSGKLMLIVHVDEGDEKSGEAKLDELQEMLRKSLNESRVPATVGGECADGFTSGFTEAGFKDAVSKARDYIAAGDLMQVVLSQRLSIPFSARSIDLYRALRSLNPSPYMFYLRFDDFSVVGSSPEILVRAQDGNVTVRPIAGTRRRGKNAAEDAALEKELLADPKEHAEHLMLIDLGRNDVGRVSQAGTVSLTENMGVEYYSHVMHIVSNVEGKLTENTTAIDVLRACFPAGTVSGAPKIRAMEIIAELEPVKRGIYSGAVGYLGFDGGMDTAIAIRTAVIKDGMLHVQAGAGIVYDSQPQAEWQESMNKASAIMTAVNIANGSAGGEAK